MANSSNLFLKLESSFLVPKTGIPSIILFFSTESSKKAITFHPASDPIKIQEVAEREGTIIAILSTHVVLVMTTRMMSGMPTSTIMIRMLITLPHILIAEDAEVVEDVAAMEDAEATPMPITTVTLAALAVPTPP